MIQGYYSPVYAVVCQMYKSITVKHIWGKRTFLKSVADENGRSSRAAGKSGWHHSNMEEMEVLWPRFQTEPTLNLTASPLKPPEVRLW